MSRASYREALSRLRAALDLLGPFRGDCGLCSWPDARHRQADAILGSLQAGEDPEVTAVEYLPDDVPDPVGTVLRVALACLAADRRLHRLTRDQEWVEARKLYAGK